MATTTDPRASHGGATSPAHDLDQEKLRACAERVVGMLVGAHLTRMLSIAHQTGLLEAMADLPPSTSAEIAATAGLHERYVREWLGSMVTGGLVEYDPARMTYRLPREHAQVVTRAGGIRNLAASARANSLLGRVEDAVADCFRRGGGVPYGAFEGFTKITAEFTARVFDAALVDRILPAVPGVVERLRVGIDVADLGCGSGRAVNLMARAFPLSRFTGYDLSEEAIAAARAEAAAWGLANAHFELADVATLRPVDAFEFVTAFDAIHDQADPVGVLGNAARMLRPGGIFLMVDIAASSNLHENIGRPLAPGLYALSTMHCMTVSLAQGGAGLGTMWGEQTARRMLAEAGFGTVTVMQVEGDIVNSYFIATRQ